VSDSDSILRGLAFLYCKIVVHIVEGFGVCVCVCGSLSLSLSLSRVLTFLYSKIIVRVVEGFRESFDGADCWKQQGDGVMLNCSAILSVVHSLQILD
jgi:hypothetical protein